MTHLVNVSGPAVGIGVYSTNCLVYQCAFLDLQSLKVISAKSFFAPGICSWCLWLTCLPSNDLFVHCENLTGRRRWVLVTAGMSLWRSVRPNCMYHRLQLQEHSAVISPHTLSLTSLEKCKSNDTPNTSCYNNAKRKDCASKQKEKIYPFHPIFLHLYQMKILSPLLVPEEYGYSGLLTCWQCGMFFYYLIIK